MRPGTICLSSAELPKGQVKASEDLRLRLIRIHHWGHVKMETEFRYQQTYGRYNKRLRISPPHMLQSQRTKTQCISTTQAKDIIYVLGMTALNSHCAYLLSAKDTLTQFHFGKLIDSNQTKKPHHTRSNWESAGYGCNPNTVITLGICFSQTCCK